VSAATAYPRPNIAATRVGSEIVPAGYTAAVARAPAASTAVATSTAATMLTAPAA